VSETLQVKTKVTEIHQESNDIYMTLTMCILTNQVNLNNARFTDDFIDGVIANKESYVGIPLVVNKTKLENGVYNTLGHEFDSNSGELKTEVIGSFYDFWKETDDDGSTLLMGSVRVFKRFPAVCEALVELYESGDLEFSCEVLVYGYESVEGKVRNIAYTYDGQVNSLFASAVVSNPAEVKSRAFTLVAEALEKDLALKGGEIVADNTPKTEVFNKGNKINFHGKIESSSLTFDEISNQIYNQLNPIDPKTGYRDYEYWISDIYNDYVIVEEWDDYNELYKIPYEVVNDTVVLAPEENWIKGTRGFIPDGVNIDSLLEAVNNASIEMENKINELNAAHKEVLQVTEEQIKELQEKVDALNKQVEELNSVVVSQKEEIVQLQNKEQELNQVIEDLKPYKEQVETAEKQAKKDALVGKFSKLLSEEVMKSEAVVNAIEALDEATLNSIVVAEVSKELASKSEDKKEKTVIVSARNQEDLVPQSRREKLYAPKSE
jgi:cell division protein FtsB